MTKSILHFIFNLIDPDSGNTWLSRRFHRWKQARHERYAIACREDDIIAPTRYFDVHSAGQIRISESCDHQTANVRGFSFSVEWSEYPFVGGVLNMSEAEKLAKMILEKCNVENNPAKKISKLE